MADIELTATNPVECISYAPDRDLPRRVVGVCTRAYTVAGELILISAVQSLAGQTELALSLGNRNAQVVLSGDIPAYVIDEMIAELGGGFSLWKSHDIASELNSELRYARYSEELKAGRLARDLSDLPGRSKLLAKLLQVAV